MRSFLNQKQKKKPCKNQNSSNKQFMSKGSWRENRESQQHGSQVQPDTNRTLTTQTKPNPSQKNKKNHRRNARTTQWQAQTKTHKKTTNGFPFQESIEDKTHKRIRKDRNVKSEIHMKPNVPGRFTWKGYKNLGVLGL